MKVAVARGMTRSRVPLIAMLALAATIGLAGCENDNGGDGAAGPTGPSGGVGPTGPTGPTVPPDPGITQGGPVTIGNGSTLTASQIAAIDTLVATLDSAAITNNRAVIEFTVKTAHGGPVLGLAPTTLRLGMAKLVPAADGLPSRWQSYVNRNARRATPRRGSCRRSRVRSRRTPSRVFRQLLAARSRLLAGTRRRQVPVQVRRGPHDGDRHRSPSSYEPSLTHRVSIAIDLSRPVARTRAGQPVHGLRARRAAPVTQRQADRRHPRTARLPRALRRARRPAPHDRVLRDLPQPGARSTRTAARSSTSPTWPTRSTPVNCAARPITATSAAGLHRAVAVRRLRVPELRVRLRGRHLSAVAAVLRELPHRLRHGPGR